MVVFVVVNGSFGRGGGYAFCGFYSMSLLMMWFSNTWMLDGVTCLRCGYMVFGRFDGYFGQVFLWFGTRFVSSFAQAFRISF
jgi:hypothetical protein